MRNCWIKAPKIPLFPSRFLYKLPYLENTQRKQIQDRNLTILSISFLNLTVCCYSVACPRWRSFVIWTSIRRDVPYIRHERGLKIRRFTSAFSYFERTMLAESFHAFALNINVVGNLNLERGYFFLIRRFVNGISWGFLGSRLWCKWVVYVPGCVI